MTSEERHFSAEMLVELFLLLHKEPTIVGYVWLQGFEQLRRHFYKKNMHPNALLDLPVIFVLTITDKYVNIDCPYELTEIKEMPATLLELDNASYYVWDTCMMIFQVKHFGAQYLECNIHVDAVRLDLTMGAAGVFEGCVPHQNGSRYAR